MGAEVTWKVKAGENCPYIGKTFKVNLVKPLPRPNASGNYSNPESFVNFLLPPRGFGEGWGGVKILRLI